MHITIKRETGFIGAMIKTKIQLNGETAGKISLGEEKKISLSEPSMEIRASQSGITSDRKTVSDGDFIILKNKRVNIILCWISLLMIGLSPTLFSSLSGQPVVFPNGLVYMLPFIIIGFLSARRMYKFEIKREEVPENNDS
ncbi:hypothetical protein [Corticicoccus populi]|uniref:Uncharacterized protein n=1 Tax=Corticicoccus populi TaxID=1812821 RepID=A0ABW5WYI2_9STAP